MQNSNFQTRKPLIDLKNVNKDFRVGKNYIRVLREINLRVFEHEFSVILGPSGCGKSTLLNTILGLEKPTTGRVVVRGENITDKKDDAIARFRHRRFGVVYQRSDWIRSINVLQNVAFPLAISNTPKREREQRAWELLKRFGIDDHAYYQPTELSGGEQQKVSIARALINSPSILVTDEPTGNLDTDSAKKVLDIFKELNEKNKVTIILVTHNLEYVSYATNTIYMKDGRILTGLGSM